MAEYMPKTENKYSTSTMQEDEDDTKLTEVQDVMDIQSESIKLQIEATVIKEGLASIPLPKGVFYNPVQELNRDITVLVLSVFSQIYLEELSCNPKLNHEKGTLPKGITILDALSATGLRAVRYALEVPNVLQVVANDIDQTAVMAIQENAKLNGVSHIVLAVCNDATMLMHENKNYDRRYDVIDLDPFGSPTPFLDSAVQAVHNGGMLCVTCTDLAVLCGKPSTTCYAKYGSTSLPGVPFTHEMALRIVIASILSHALRYGRYIEPLVSFSVDFYVRVFVRVRRSKSKAKEGASKVGMVYACTGCRSYYLQPMGVVKKSGKSTKYAPAFGPPVNMQCDVCKSTLLMGGPAWLDPINDKDFMEKLVKKVQFTNATFNTKERMKGLLSMISEELPDCPFFYELHDLCSVVKATSCKWLKIASAIKNAGYSVSSSHIKPCTLKTDIPRDKLWDIIRQLANNEKPLFELELPAQIILSTPSQITADFTMRNDVISKTAASGMVRFPMKPPNWGPKSKPKRIKQEEIEPNDPM